MSNSGKNDFDAYELLHYYFAKLETMATVEEIYYFLLSFVRSTFAEHQSSPPACLFLVDKVTFDFVISAFEPSTVNADFFEKELAGLIDDGIVAWTVRNHRMGTAKSTQSPNDHRCLLFPLYTKKDFQGFILIYTDFADLDLSHQIIQSINLACLQTAVFAENMCIQKELLTTQSRMIAYEKLSAIGMIAAGIAHEINTPVGFVKGNSEVLTTYIKKVTSALLSYRSACSNVVSKKLWEDLDLEFIIGDMESIAHANIIGLNRIAAIVANLKDFARKDQKDPYQIADLEENIRKTLIVARNELKYCTEIVTNFGNVSHVYCNIGQVNQVFLNIIVNAAYAIIEKHKNEKGILTITTRDDAETVYCIFSDNGCGIVEENLKKIFDPFFTTKPIGKGTGLGLNIAFDIIINKHHGDITVNSEFGSGATFTISLPKSGLLLKSNF